MVYLAIDLRSGAGIGISFDFQMPVVVGHLIMVSLICTINKDCKLRETKTRLSI